MDRSDKLKRKARNWKIAGTLAFLIGAFLVWERVSYNLHDFYGENFAKPTKADLFFYSVVDPGSHLELALNKMDSENYWEAVTELEHLKQSNASNPQFAEWYKILCLIALDERESAIALLEYYTEQEEFTWKRAEAERLLEQY